MSERTAVYRLYDGDDALLYVGVSTNPQQRWYDHAKKPWWRHVTTRQVVWHDDRLAALAEEATAIADETPRFNTTKPPGHFARLLKAREQVGKTSPDEAADRVSRARIAADDARVELFAAIKDGLTAGVSLAEIARRAKFSAYYVAKIRDGKTGPNTP